MDKPSGGTNNQLLGCYNLQMIQIELTAEIASFPNNNNNKIFLFGIIASQQIVPQKILRTAIKKLLLSMKVYTMKFVYFEHLYWPLEKYT